MNRAVFFPVLFFLAARGALAAGALPDSSLEGRLAAHVRFLSSPTLAGREAGSEGERAAAEYIAGRFLEIGLSAIGAGDAPGSFLHTFAVGAEGRIEGCAAGDEPFVPAKRMGNVIGAVDPDREGRVLVIGAHYDHLGMKDGVMHPGADDNASGVALLIETARAFARENPHEGPVVFAAFTGEEAGLLGSRAYVCRPPVPLSEAAAMVNVDMVGRLGGGPLLVAVAGLLEEARDSLAALLPADPPTLEMRSGYEAGDLASFAGARVPSMMLFTGPHADYHRPTDTEEKIDYEGLARVTRFAREAAPLFARLARGFHGEGVSSGAPPPDRERPFLGTLPDFSVPAGDGVLVASVAPGSPAESAGVLPGDLVTGVGGHAVRDLAGYAAALRAHRPGDRVWIRIRRGAETLVLEAVLARRETPPEGAAGHPAGAREGGR
ncbi:MAG: M20/M25/M40 family metallo-hydrolase [Candidatus Eisenbacteria bacterium]|nr:M20/M25/M40 family metallo-hydrolase [Candidatus Eisenbacteria bacterium]